MTDLAAARSILELARWAPSGDNTQPWRFQIVSPEHVVVHGFDTRSYCVYDLDGHSSQLAIGGLLESIRIAASGLGLHAAIARRRDAPDEHPRFDVHLRAAPGAPSSELLDCLKIRTVQRRPLSTRALTLEEKGRLETSVGPGFRVAWLEGRRGRWRAARLLWHNARLRLTLPEAFEVHRRIIEWGAHFSEDRIPERALGANWVTGKLMHFALQRWSRVEFMNRWLGGTVAPRVELDLIPGMACGAHFLVHAASAPVTIDDFVSAGAAMQRFWLTATLLQLQLQPEMTPLIFARYATVGRKFSRLSTAEADARSIAAGIDELFGPDAATHGVFMGRIGAGPAPMARSLRLPIERLLVPS